jgi:restriction system protein
MQVIQIDDIEAKYTNAGNHSGYCVAMYHEGLEDTRHLSAREVSVLEGKISNQVNVWEKKWARQIEIQENKDKEQQAMEMTVKSKAALKSIEELLAYTLDIDDAVDWDKLKIKKAVLPKLKEIPKEPLPSEYMTKPSFFKALFGGAKKHAEQQELQYKQAVEEWSEIKSTLENQNNQTKNNYDATERKRLVFNEKVDEFKICYAKKDPESIVEYCELVLNNSEYPDSFPRDFEIEFNEANGMVVVDFQLPSISEIPSRTLVRYIKSRDALEEKFLSQINKNKLFDSAIYQITLRTLHELFEADVIGALSMVTFNGFVTAVNPSTGHEETKCILSVQASKVEFMEINLANIDPKLCFKSLKGVGSSKLSSITSVPPILELDKSDKRFRDHYEVAGGMDESTNLAVMAWEDFEHLVRELFEKEFAQNGGEVKVTQASSDGGVDAVAFDPDPIRGGKIVIQAKRYTNTVGVAAVRDLYGTVMNEGATKGILVTTSDYGPDSYSFAKDKPLTLLNGSNLLSLLEKHGHKAKIDIKEAKRLMKEE